MILRKKEDTIFAASYSSEGIQSREIKSDYVSSLFLFLEAVNWMIRFSGFLEDIAAE